MTTHNTNASDKAVGKPRLTPAQRQAIAQERAQGSAIKALAARVPVADFRAIVGDAMAGDATPEVAHGR